MKNNKFEILLLTLVFSALSITWENNYASLGFLVYLSFLLYSVIKIFLIGKILIKFGLLYLVANIWIFSIVLMIIINLNNIPFNIMVGLIIKLLIIIILSNAFLLYIFSNPKNNIRNILISNIFSSIILIIWVLINEWEILITFNERVGWSGSGANPNFIGLIISLFSFVTLFKFLQKRSKYLLLLLITQYFIIFMTGSKKALINVILSLILLPFFHYKKSSKIKLKYLVLSAATILLILYMVMNVEILYSVIGRRIESTISAFKILDYRQDNSTVTRLKFIMLGLNYWKLRPIIGQGFGAFTYKIGIGTYTHNNYIEILISHGLIGLLVYYSFFVYLMVSVYKHKFMCKYFSLFLTILISIFIQDFAMVSYYDFVWYHIWAIIIFVVIFAHKYRLKRGTHYEKIN